LSLNGVFSADYDNYRIVIRHGAISVGGGDITMRLRASGTDSTATTDYNHQKLEAAASTVSAARVTTQGSWTISGINTDDAGGMIIDIYAPYLSTPTAFRSVTVCRNPDIQDNAGTHELSTAYDGFSINLYLGTSGRVAVYGMRK